MLVQPKWEELNPTKNMIDDNKEKSETTTLAKAEGNQDQMNLKKPTCLLENLLGRIQRKVRLSVKVFQYVELWKGK